jgi:hypothetical protein
MAKYWGASQLAARFGVATGTITKWISRFADTTQPFPAPDVEIVETGGRVTRGWSPDRWDEIKLWADADRYDLRRQEKKVIGEVVNTKYSDELFSYGQPPVLRPPQSPDSRPRPRA